VMSKEAGLGGQGSFAAFEDDKTQPYSLFQNLARNQSPSRDTLCSVSALAAEFGGSSA
jgi:hypothetical protein